MPKDKTKRICLWSGPRNISTALMYSFAQRADTTVVDEPLYAHYLTSTDARDYHPGADEVIVAQHNDAKNVMDEVIFGDYDTPIVFFKQMTHHLVNVNRDFLNKMSNVLLTRDPQAMLLSYSKQVDEPTMRDVGYAMQVELLSHLKKIGQKPPVLDSKKILQNPREELTKLCQRLDIPFNENMLSWEAGPRPEDGSWAQYWYEGVHHSTGFKPYQPKTEPVPDRLKPLLEECKKLYEILTEAN